MSLRRTGWIDIMNMKSPFDLDPEQLNELLALGAEATQFRPGQRPETGRGPEGSKAKADRLGAWIDRYKLVSFLGEGGMALVYLAQQEYPIQRKVALKLIKPGMDSTRIIARFEAERQALAQLHHPNIAQIFDAGTTEEGRPYFVMEYVEGQSITAYCDRHHVSIDDRLGLFQQVCHGIHHAHQRGIIHRDIKASNVLIDIQDDQVVPKIIDFGVARAVRQPLVEHTVQTEDGHLIGTPEYMSPEQVNLGSEGIDVRSDVYSLGVLLYVLLTGALPFDAKRLRQGGIDAVRRVIREEDPKTPSTRLVSLAQEAPEIAANRDTEVQLLARRLRRELEWIPLKAMRKEREERYQSASELAGDIQSYLEGGRLLAGPPSTVYRLRKFLRRHKALVAGVLVVLAVSLMGTVVSIILAMGQARARTEAQAVSDFLRHSVLESLDPFKVGGRRITIRSVFDVASESLEGNFAGPAIAEAEIRFTVGHAYWSLGIYDQAERHLSHALAIQQHRLGSEDPATLASMHYLGWLRFSQSRYAEAEQLLLQARDARRNVLGEQHPDTLLSMSALACTYTMHGRFEEAEELIERALQAARALDAEHPYVPPFMNALALTYEQQGRYEEAEYLAAQGLAIAQRVLGKNDWFALLLKHTLAKTYRAQGRYKEAEDLLQITLQGRQEAWGPEHPDTLETMADLGWLYYNQGRYEEAETLLREALDATGHVLGEEHIITAHCLRGLGTLYLSQGRYHEAERSLKQALEIAGGLLGEKNYHIPKGTNTLAEVYMAQGRLKEAEKEFLQTLEAKRHVWSDDHPEICETINDLAVLRREQQRYEKAESLLRKALDGRQRRLGQDHPDTLESMHELALLYIAKEDHEQAAPLLLDAFHGREEKLGPKHPHTIDSLHELVNLYESWPKPDEAAKWRAKLLEAGAGEE